MKALHRLGLVASALTVLSLSVRAAAPGYIDLGRIKPTDGCEYVEVNLGAPLLKFASLFVGGEDPDTASLIRNLKHVRVNVVGYNDGSRAETMNRVRSIRREIETQGWTQIVSARENENAENVAIYVKTATDDSIEGLVITVIDSSKREAVFVNVVGNIKPEQVAKIGRGLHIEPLADIDIACSGKG